MLTRHRWLLWVVLIPLLASMSAQAQSTGSPCDGWTGVTSWLLTATATGTASQTDASQSYQLTAQANVSGVLVTQAACSPKTIWTGPSGPANDLGGTGSFNSSISLLNSGKKVVLEAIDGAGAVNDTSAGLYVDTANRVYGLAFKASVPATFTITPGTPTATTYSGSAGVIRLGCTTGIPTFPLPAVVGPISNTVELTNCDLTTSLKNKDLVDHWTVTYTLTPQNFTDQCSQAGNSTIGCQNQTLGEDVPVAGTPFGLHYDSSRASGQATASTAATADAARLGGFTLSVHHVFDPKVATLYLGSGGLRNGWQLGTPLLSNGNTLIAAIDGTEIYVFDHSGRHLQTLTAMTGGVKYAFSYDAAGELSSIRDGSGNVTTLTRSASGTSVSLTAPFGEKTTVVLDKSGHASEITDPLGRAAQFSFDSGGLLQSRKDYNGALYRYGFDATKRLTLDADPAGGSFTLNRSYSSSGYTVTEKTALDRVTRYQVGNVVASAQGAGYAPGQASSITWPSGLTAKTTTALANGQILSSVNLPDGTSDSSKSGPDPRFGLQAPILASETTVAGPLTRAATGSRQIMLQAANAPLSLASQTDSLAVNGRTTTTVYTAANRTYTTTSPEKRVQTTTVDMLERPVAAAVGKFAAVHYAYDANGRLSTVSQGSRTASFSYDSGGYLSAATDPLGHKTHFSHDATGRLLSTTAPDGSVTTFGHDANGNLTSLTPPGREAHQMAYTVVNKLDKYTPPAVSGTGPTSYAYDAERQLTSIALPNGMAVDFSYDAGGRLATIKQPTSTVTYSYAPNSGNVTSASVSGGEQFAVGYGGPLPTTSTWTGAVTGSVSRTYDNNFWVTGVAVDNSPAITYGYDKDGLLTKAGALTLNPDASSGLLLATALGAVTDTFAYSTYGELASYTASHGATPLYSLALTRDAIGRITAKSEIVSGKTVTVDYSYDLRGRLSAVTRNGTTTTYAYDGNSNRLSLSGPGGKVSATYDAQDALLTYGNAAYSYNAMGSLASRRVGTQSTSYTYDAVGNLLIVKLASGTVIDYVVDGQNRRVGKKVNGVLTKGFLYDGPGVVAELDGRNTLVSRFVYASRRATPDYLIRGGETYRIIADAVGSPVLVVNTATGAIVQQISYDEFGNVQSDTNPGFQPFGFAGGLYDEDTKLLRFGFRDYDPAVGRWTTRDPLRFAAGDDNLYAYAFSDPVNLSDVYGLSVCQEVEKKIKEKFKSWWDGLAHLQLGRWNVTADAATQSVQAGTSANISAWGFTFLGVSFGASAGINPGVNGAPVGDLFNVKVDDIGLTVLGQKLIDIPDLFRASFGDLSQTPSAQAMFAPARKLNSLACQQNADQCQ